MTLATSHFEKFLTGHVRTSLETCLSNLKSVAWTVFELLAFNAQKFGATWPWPRPHFEKFLNGHVQTVLGNMLVKYEVRRANHFEAIGI